MSENENMPEDMKEMAIEETTDEVMVDPLDELVQSDFTEDVNIDEYAEIINLMGRDSTMLKNEEAEEIIKTSSEKYLDKEYLDNLEKTYENIKKFYAKYDPNNMDELGEAEKTKIYTVGNFLNMNYSNLIDGLLFNIDFTRAEYKLISTAIERKLSYDGNEVFNIIDLNENYLKIWKEEFKQLPKDQDIFNVTIDIKNIVMMYHFLQKHVVKGLSEEFYHFATVLQKIAETNKIYNAFNIKRERAKTNFLTWTSAIDETNKLAEEPTNDAMVVEKQ